VDIVIDPYGEYFFEILNYVPTSSSSGIIYPAFRKTQLSDFSLQWTLNFGSENGNIVATKGLSISSDNSFIIQSFANSNTDYGYSSGSITPLLVVNILALNGQT